MPRLAFDDRGATIIGTVVGYVSVDSTETDWRDDQGDDRAWGWLLEVDEAVWNPFHQSVFEVIPIVYGSDCVDISYGRSEVEKYSIGTQIWLIGGVLDEVEQGPSSGTRLRADYGLWDVVDSEIKSGANKPFDFEEYFSESSHSPWRSPGFAQFALHRIIAKLHATPAVIDRVDMLRSVQHYLRRGHYEQFLQIHEPDESIHGVLLQEHDEMALIKRYGRFRPPDQQIQDDAIAWLNLSTAGLRFSGGMLELPAHIDQVISVLGEPTHDKPSSGDGNRRLDWNHHAIYAFANPSTPDIVHYLGIYLALPSYSSRPERSFEAKITIDWVNLTATDPKTNRRRFADSKTLERLGFQRSGYGTLNTELGTYRVELSPASGSEFSEIAVMTTIGAEERMQANERSWREQRNNPEKSELEFLQILFEARERDESEPDEEVEQP